MSTRYQRFHSGGWHRERSTTANPEVAELARAYNATHGLAEPRDVVATLTPEEGRALATAYEQARDTSPPAEVRAAYSAMNSEVEAQYRALRDAGYTIEPWTRPGQPYANSAEMMADIREHHHLWFFKSTEGTVPHSLLSHAQNDRFRAVHDFFGHAKGGNQFGPSGETSAFVSHVQMFSPSARPAVATETLAQNAWFNYGPHANLPVNERPFAEQKAIAVHHGLYEPVLVRSLGHARQRPLGMHHMVARPAWTGRPR